MTNLLTVAEDEPEVPKENEKWSLFKSYVKNEVEYYKKLSWYWKIIYWIEAPMTILRNATIPVVMEERYNKFHLLLTSFGIPLFLFYKSEKAWTDSMFGVPCWLFRCCFYFSSVSHLGNILLQGGCSLWFCLSPSLCRSCGWRRLLTSWYH